MKKNKKILIIAEAGINHNGSLKRAIKMIKEAKNAGADVIKFQTAVPELVATNNAKKADYQKTKTLDKESQLQMIKKLHLPLTAYKILQRWCKKYEITFMSSPFDLISAKYLINIKIKQIKIPSGEITNYPLLKYLAKKNVKIILSTGMSNLNEIKKSIRVLKKFGKTNRDISVLHCNTSYPTPNKDVNLNVIETLHKELNLNIGYSDHTMGFVTPIAAVAKGAKIIEKHFTLNKNLKGPDQLTSLNPKEFLQMVKSIRDCEDLMGGNKKIVTKSEFKNKKIVRKSIVAKKIIKKGTIFNESNLTVKRPGTGLSPMIWEKVLGKRAKKNFKIDDLITL